MKPTAALFFLLALIRAASAADPQGLPSAPQNPGAPPGAKVTVAFERPEYCLRESVEVQVIQK